MTLPSARRETFAQMISETERGMVAVTHTGSDALSLCAPTTILGL